MEIVGRVATIDVQTIAVLDRQEKTVVRAPTTGVQGRKAVRDRQEKTEAHVLTTEAQGQKAVRDQ
jgi:hypothetical protein